MTDPATEVKKPVRPPSATHHVIVKLETIHVPPPEVNDGDLGAGVTHEIIGYEYTRPSESAVAAARAWPASVLITTTVPINGETLGEAPYLKCIITETVGTDHIDLEECRRRGVTVIYSPNATVEAVSEHALGLYFSSRRRFVTLHNTMMDHAEGRPNPWRAKGSMSSLLLDSEGRPPHTCGNEVVGMIGYGPIGQRVAKMCRALGMEVLVAARKSDAAPAVNGNEVTATTTASQPNGNGDAHRTPFAEVIRRATTLFLIVPLTAETKNLVGEAEMATMRPDVVIINVGRGGTVNEAALVAALREGRISGAATDVYEVEPAGSGRDSVLLGEEARGLNLTLTPHLAWCADQTRVNIRRVVGENVRLFFGGGKSSNVVLDMR
ncbi:D-isomer specific 2-hydroxyacid dehydrogenase [Colletotrichum scovillei]|uniref:Glycerate dehydrogenase n=1 Tax=Colletotrichum scovillei TaxID=1209932 RepID=A0A9P7QTJ2_9PEZI|nr:D-isomer specific 2-hydroxyacid dehydrogenase [Colletotrichum scovillei]KAF4775087.1 D-isomer specific 2-hydroxyacid dehydrogenase [Colletotrichum scovillei]KAG7042645.1 glycerate dehydrogenase [Colletotrichum scovillei]KAG7043235.1 glycerate dehydrogenase [Colletotrichum scovillei]KAG7062681.1 glycerate dehydrogenase [Colletotrichum scovillei]